MNTTIRFYGYNVHNRTSNIISIQKNEQRIRHDIIAYLNSQELVKLIRCIQIPTYLSIRLKNREATETSDKDHIITDTITITCKLDSNKNTN